MLRKSLGSSLAFALAVASLLGPVSVPASAPAGRTAELFAGYLSPGELRLHSPAWRGSQAARNMQVTVSDMAGRTLHAGAAAARDGTLRIQGIPLPPGLYQACAGEGSRGERAGFRVTK